MSFAARFRPLFYLYLQFFCICIFFFFADDCPAVAPQIPTAAAHRGGDGRRRGGHEQRGPDSDLHLPGEPVHSRHGLPEHRREKPNLIFYSFIPVSPPLSPALRVAGIIS